VCVDPEGPECIVQIEGDQFREGQAVGESCGGHGGVLEGVGVLAFGAEHGKGFNEWKSRAVR
jgi:hypothetical protein